MTLAAAGCGEGLPSYPQVVATAAAPVPDRLPVIGPVDPADTGVPDGTVLRSSGPLVLTRDGEVVEGLDVDGCVRVIADDVTIRDTRIRCDTPGPLVVEVADGADGFVLERSEVDGAGVVDIGVGWSRFTLRQVDIHHVNDGARFGHQVLVEHSWIHDMTRIGDLHPDGLQTTSGSATTIRGNHIDPRNDVSGSWNNAAIMLGSETGTRRVHDVIIEDNFLAGGQFALNVRGDISADGVIVRDNVFGDSRYGAVLSPQSVPLAVGNVDQDGGQVAAEDP